MADELKPLSDPSLDMCECGDYRRDHKDGVGECIHNKRGDLTHGMKNCEAFRPVSPARPPQVAELVKIGREFYEAAIEAKPEVIVSSALLMRASDLIDRLATALAAQGDGA